MDDKDDWELEFSKYNFDFVKRLSDFRVRKDFCDAAFEVGTKKCCFHSAILAASSRHFYETLLQNWCHDQKPNGKGDDINLVEAQLEADVERLLTYIYGEYTVSSVAQINTLHSQYAMSVTQCGPKLMRELNKLRVGGEFCDVTLKINDDIFPAHRVVLAAGSPYFYTLFTSDMKERREGFVHVQIPELCVTQDLLSYMYTGSVRISDLNAVELWIAADYLLLEELKLRCYLYLEFTVSVLNCLSIHSFAKYYGLVSLQNIARQFIEEKFTEVANTEEFLELSAAGVDELLSSDALDVPGEETVYESLVAWTKHNLGERAQYFEGLFLNNIRVGLIDPKYIRRSLQKEELIKTNEECFNRVQQALSEILQREEPRTGYSAFYLFSLQRDCRDNALKFVCYDVQHGACLELEPPQDTQATTDTVELASCNGQVYAVDVNGRMCCYTPQTNRWTQLPSIPDVVPSIFSPGRWGHGLASLDGCLYVSGGNTTLGEPDGLTLKYDCKANAWEMVASLNVERCGNCLVASDGYIYAIGGEDRNLRSCQTVERYHPRKDFWSLMSPMTAPKGERPKGIAVRDKIFVCMENICELQGCEIYDATADLWQCVASPRAHKMNPPLGSDGSKVYVLGGRSCVKHSLSNLTRVYSIIKVQVLDINTNQWRHQGAVFTTGSPINSCSMQVHRKCAPSGENSCCIL